MKYNFLNEADKINFNIENNNMKVLYDITVLGEGLCHTMARTGIFRVVENIAIGLSKHPDCELILFSNIKYNRVVKEYLKNTPYFYGCKFSEPVDGLLMNLLTYCMEQRNRLSIKIKEEKWNNLPLRVFRKPYTFSEKLLLSIQGNKSDVDLNDLKRADIYHSAAFYQPAYFRDHDNITIFQTIHDLIPLMFPEYFAFNESQKMRELINNLSKDDFIICVSHSTRNDLLNNFNKFEPEKVIVAYNAASDSFYPCNSVDDLKRVRRKYSIPESCRYLLCVGTLEPRKNISHLIKSFANLIISEKINDLFLVVTGAMGWSYDNIFNEIDYTVGAREKIILTGYVDDDDLSPLYTGAMAFIFPSLYEGFGLPPLEAMQCGTPVITSNTSSLPEIVGDAGIMIDPHDTDSLCDAILKVYKSEKLRNEMSRRSIERAKLFSWERCVNEIVAAYKKAKGLAAV